jgi:hypothetical protein
LYNLSRNVLHWRTCKGKIQKGTYGGNFWVSWAETDGYVNDWDVGRAGYSYCVVEMFKIVFRKMFLHTKHTSILNIEDEKSA